MDTLKPHPFGLTESASSLDDPGPGVVTTPGSTHVAKLETPASWASGSPSPGTQGGSRGRSKSRRSWGSNCMGLYTPLMAILVGKMMIQ